MSVKNLKTEHSGSKKGNGAFYGRKVVAKRASNKDRRVADRQAEAASPLVKCEACNGLGEVDVTPARLIGDDQFIDKCRVCDGVGRITWERLNKWRWTR